MEIDAEVFQNGRFAADKAVHARFYTKPVVDKAASAEAGRTIHKEVEYVEILAAGNPNNIVHRRATREDRSRFEKQYSLFKQGNENQVTGTHLAEVAWLSRSQVEELAYLHIRSLEQLANVSDEVCSRTVGLYELKKKAAMVLERAAGEAPLHQLQAENERLAKQVEELTAQLASFIESQKKAK